ncbi:hypothetical protein EfsSVR2330_24640 [Enterococcus faecalis]|uniref:hypothetical protein n=1 Tax=Enterococcus faecalis TaxID=1351 RepID=UPI002302FDE6|nr:hypothetical protein [Enterococcus faecalis]BDQ54953.1 hypothetical protein EfsSVR2330_24640 [Enterococcus faecalis]
MPEFCKVCTQNTLMHIDDEGGLGGASSYSWDHYICRTCLSEKDVIHNGEEETVKWIKRKAYIVRSENEMREIYHHLKEKAE